MKAKPKAKRVVVKAAELRKLDAAARKRELAAFAANPSMKMPVLINLKAKGVRIKWPDQA
jgi:hypothetical protein